VLLVFDAWIGGVTTLQAWLHWYNDMTSSNTDVVPSPTCRVFKRRDTGVVTLQDQILVP
jgi:hypothetical protein